jgi:hypothetical protein
MADIRPDGSIAIGTNPPTPGREASSAMETYDTNWWRDNYGELEGVQADRGYAHYEPALRYGWESAGRHRGRGFDDAERDLERDWSSRPGAPGAWADNRHAVRHAFERAMHVFEGTKDPDARR